MKNEPRIAIIILNWNGFEDTVECLESLKKIEYENYGILLIDNGSENDEGARLKKEYPYIELLQNKTNRGFAGGSNDGMNYALDHGYDYIVNLNNDCLVEKQWLKRLVRGVQDSFADFGTCRIMFFPDKDKIYSDGDVLLPDGSGFASNRLQISFASSGIVPIFSACGAGSIYSRKCLEMVKLKGSQFFDELYFAYYEDLDLGMRLSAKGFFGVAVLDSVIFHKSFRTAGKYSYFNRFQIEKNRILNLLLDYPFPWIILAEIFYWFKIIVRTLSPAGEKTGQHVYLESIGWLKLLKAMMESRIWIMKNLGAIIRDRRERKTKGLIDPAIYRNFYWKLKPGKK